MKEIENARMILGNTSCQEIVDALDKYSRPYKELDHHLLRAQSFLRCWACALDDQYYYYY